VPHAGICAGGVGQPASLPQLFSTRVWLTGVSGADPGRDGLPTGGLARGLRTNAPAGPLVDAELEPKRQDLNLHGEPGLKEPLHERHQSL